MSEPEYVQVFKRDRKKLAFCKIAFELHQPKYAYRLLELFHYVSTECHLPDPFYMVLTHLVATFFLLQVVPTMSEVSFKGFESATNMLACGA